MRVFGNQKFFWFDGVPELILLIIGLLLGSQPALAVTFPADEDWTPLTRSGVPVWDIVGDGQLERDLVGDSSTPVAFLAWDAQHLFLRIRVDTTPIQSGTTLRPYAWGMEIDTDGDLTDYEFLLMVDGIANPDVLTFQENTTQGSVGDPNDNCETVLSSYNWLSEGRVVPAATAFNGDPDFFLDWAYPLTDLVSAGIGEGTTVALWAGSSNNPRSLASDLASETGGTTIPELASDRVVLVPVVTAVETTPPVYSRLRLEPDGPNPTSEWISFSVGLSEPAHVNLEIFDVRGRRLWVGDADQPIGWTSHRIKDSDLVTGSLPSGVYYYRVRALGETQTRKITILR
jgi:hypothetical protein